ncbi:hypothetical protein SDC9_132734 [bioreactor metagenome]|uniref:Uncharacterized protein n=1 Tax=bioreactor metagenome TaxID=1076179 RepID=A0A645D9P9_9ZZZZ
MFPGDFSHSGDVHQIAGQVGGVGADDGFGFGSYQLLKVGIINISLPAGRDEG